MPNIAANNLITSSIGVPNYPKFILEEVPDGDEFIIHIDTHIKVNGVDYHIKFTKKVLYQDPYVKEFLYKLFLYMAYFKEEEVKFYEESNGNLLLDHIHEN